MIHPCVLTIAGSDSGGNAGIQADLRAFHAYGLHGCTVLTALTAQNPAAVSAIHPVPPDFIAAQLACVLGTYAIGAIKTGMIATPEAIETVASHLARVRAAKVVDPVMIATSGAPLMSDAARAAFVQALAPQATLLTPNLPEAEALAGLARASAESASDVRARALAHALFDRFGCAVLVKGGHGTGAMAEDILFDGTTFTAFPLPWVAHPVSTHGTGCTLAAALAAELACGRALAAAVAGAKRYVHAAIRTSYRVGENCGVLGFAQPNNFDRERDGMLEYRQ